MDENVWNQLYGKVAHHLHHLHLTHCPLSHPQAAASIATSCLRSDDRTTSNSPNQLKQDSKSTLTSIFTLYYAISQFPYVFSIISWVWPHYQLWSVASFWAGKNILFTPCDIFCMQAILIHFFWYASFGWMLGWGESTSHEWGMAFRYILMVKRIKFDGFCWGTVHFFFSF